MDTDITAGLHTEAEAAGCGGSTRAAILITRIVAVLAELEAELPLEDQAVAQRMLIAAIDGFGKLLHESAAAQSPEAAYKASFRGAITAALRRSGPDTPAEAFVKILAEELNGCGL